MSDVPIIGYEIMKDRRYPNISNMLDKANNTNGTENYR